MDCLLACLADENVEVRGMASKALSGIVRCSQRQSIVPLKVRLRSQCGHCTNDTGTCRIASFGKSGRSSYLIDRALNLQILFELSTQLSLEYVPSLRVSHTR